MKIPRRCNFAIRLYCRWPRHCMLPNADIRIVANRFHCIISTILPGTRLGVSGIFRILLKHESKLGITYIQTDFGNYMIWVVLGRFSSSGTILLIETRRIWNFRPRFWDAKKAVISNLIWKLIHIVATPVTYEIKVQTPAVNSSRRVRLCRSLSCSKRMLSAMPCMAMPITM